jgi:hypothetical protein
MIQQTAFQQILCDPELVVLGLKLKVLSLGGQLDAAWI